MSGASNDQGQMTVGLDVGDKHVHACFLDHHGYMAMTRTKRTLAAQTSNFSSSSDDELVAWSFGKGLSQTGMYVYDWQSKKKVQVSTESPYVQVDDGWVLWQMGGYGDHVQLFAGSGDF
jgi:hypothetical protein